MGFNLFECLDPAIVSQESRDPRPSSVPAVWPSEASATRLDQSIWPIVGACSRKVQYRMNGYPVSNQIDAIGAWKWVTGRLMETNIVDLARAADPPVYVASGIRHYVRDMYLPFELDLVVLDPETKRPWIAECKTYSGYYAEKEIEKLGQPKLENILQDCIYLLEVPTGKKMKEVIQASFNERITLDGMKADAEAKGGKFEHRNRIEVNHQMLEQIGDGPTGAKLVYVNRGTCARTEFDVSIAEDFDGSHYPVVNGQMLKIFTVESIYQRYRAVQDLWFAARNEAVRRLQEQGVEVPPTLKLVLSHGENSQREIERILTLGEKKAESEYTAKLNKMIWSLPDEYLAPAEYEWAYSPEKVELMFSRGLISKVKYQNWRKKNLKIGDWQCLYCAYKTVCVPKQNPLWAHEVYDLNTAEEETE